MASNDVIDKLDKQNFINMNYQNENDNSFNTLISKVNALQKSVDMLIQKLGE
tara:strand:+ start:408 stop:563 length:156 start_codon:yes stop_codon:yes gene_type:complete